MSKPQQSPVTITSTEIEKWVDADSDFGFELQVFSSLMLHCSKCEHAGTYKDPVTKKLRQFDIRCYIRGPRCMANLAVECKNLTDSFPLVVQCVPRLS